MIAEATVDPEFDAEVDAPARPRAVAAARLAAGLVQGLALYLLAASDAAAWPAKLPALHGALFLAFALAPLVVVGGLGRIRLPALAGWTLVACAVLAAFGWHDIEAGTWSGPQTRLRLEPAFAVFAFGAVFLFIGHHLVGPADQARKLLAPYRFYFDWAWKGAVQVVLAAGFVAVLWVSLALGAQLFALIGVDAIRQLLGKPWFWIPLTCVAFAAGVELTDVRLTLIRGVRTVGLALLSWLLPLMTALAAAFLLALPFTGLARLFGAHSATTTVLAAAAALIVLVSAAYGGGEVAAPLLQRWAARIACLALTPLFLIAADALWLRVGQHGLTPDRVLAIACTGVVGGFAIGYAAAALRRTGAWLKPLERVNVAMACVAMLAILSLFTPIADPARLSVDDQVGRLLAAGAPPSTFDFGFLAERSGKYGADALKRLAALKGGARARQIGALALEAEAARSPATPAKPLPFVSRFTVFPAGARLPSSFAGQDWSDDGPAYQACVNGGGDQCVAVLADVDGDGSPEVLVTQETSDRNVLLDIFKQGADGRWWDMGQLNVACPDAVAALKAGRLKLAPRTGFDVELNGRRQALTPSAAPCPVAAPGPATAQARVSPLSHEPAIPTK